MNEQRKDLELMDLTIAKYQHELEQVQLENQELRMRRPPRNLAPLQDQHRQMDEMDPYEEEMQQQVDESAYQNQEQAQPGNQTHQDIDGQEQPV